MSRTFIVTPQNDTNSSLSKHFDPIAADQADFVAWLVVTPTISFIGACFNLVALTVTCPQPGVKSSFGILVFHFILVNLAMCLIIIPGAMFIVIAKWYGHAATDTCKYFQILYIAGMNAVNWSDAVLALNRCVAIFLPHTYRGWAETSVNVRLIVAVWVFSLLGPILVASGTGAGWFVQLSLGHCIYAQATTPLGDFAGSIGASVPYFITGIGAVLILWKTYTMTNQHTVSVVGTNRTQGTRSDLRRLAMARTLLFTFIWTLICTLPAYLFRYLAPPVSASGAASWLIPALWLRTAPACQYGITPCILLLSNAGYRSRLAQIIRRIRKVESRETAVVDLGSRTKTTAIHP